MLICLDLLEKNGTPNILDSAKCASLGLKLSIDVDQLVNY